MRRLTVVTSDRRPDLIDRTSSPTTVYVRENVIQRDAPVAENEEPRKEYVYDELQYTQMEYAIEVAAQAQADADYAVMMAEG